MKSKIFRTYLMYFTVKEIINLLSFCWYYLNGYSLRKYKSREFSYNLQWVISRLPIIINSKIKEYLGLPWKILFISYSLFNNKVLQFSYTMQTGRESIGIRRRIRCEYKYNALFTRSFAILLHFLSTRWNWNLQPRFCYVWGCRGVLNSSFGTYEHLRLKLLL